MPDGGRLRPLPFRVQRPRARPVGAFAHLQDAAGSRPSITVDGNDYLKNAITERFSIADGQASWTNKVESGEQRLEDPAFYLSQSGTPAELPMLAKAALAAPGGRSPSCHPARRARWYSMCAR